MPLEDLRAFLVTGYPIRPILPKLDQGPPAVESVVIKIGKPNASVFENTYSSSLNPKEDEEENETYRIVDIIRIRSKINPANNYLDVEVVKKVVTVNKKTGKRRVTQMGMTTNIGSDFEVLRRDVVIDNSGNEALSQFFF